MPADDRLRSLVRARRRSAAASQHARTDRPLRLALDLGLRQRRPRQPGHPPDGHRPLVPRRERTSAPRRSASAAASATSTTARRRTRRSSYHDYANAPLIFEVRGLPSRAGLTGSGVDPRANADTAGMDNYRGVGIGNVIDCEGGSVIIKSYTAATAVDKDGKVMKEFKGTDRHMQNFIDVVRSRKTGDLYGPDRGRARLERALPSRQHLASTWRGDFGRQAPRDDQRKLRRSATRTAGWSSISTPTTAISDRRRSRSAYRFSSIRRPSISPDRMRRGPTQC